MSNKLRRGDWVDYKKLKKSLTDNVKANELMSPFYFVLILFLLHFHHKIMFWKGWNFQSGIILSLLSTFAYIFASNYYQPDLDIHRNRPGMGHFPLGRWIGRWKYGRFLKFIFYPINRAWYYLWHPYGQAMTHRGFGHYPIIGVFLRTIYLYCALKSVQLFLLFFGINLTLLNSFISFLLSFFPGHKDFASVSWFLFCFPVYVSDLIHFLVDYYDSARKGMTFCPKAIPRGWIASFIDNLKIFKKN